MSSKISREFDTRLHALAPQGRVRAVVLLAPPVLESTSAGSRPSRQERQVRAAALRETSAPLRIIDEILESHGGRRLSPSSDSLGTITVETTADGIRAIAESAGVRAILEDQQLRALSRSAS